MRKHQTERSKYPTRTAADRERLVRRAPQQARLDGVPAAISGYSQPFATVTTPYHEKTWSWQAVAVILYERDGVFES